MICLHCGQQIQGAKCPRCGYILNGNNIVVSLFPLDSGAMESGGKTMNCAECGKELQPEWRRCPFCGTAVPSADQKPDAINPVLVKKTLAKIASDCGWYGLHLINPKEAGWFLKAINLGLHYRVSIDFTKIISQDPQNAWFYYFRAKSYEVDGQIDKALADYDEAIKMDSEQDWFYFKRGQLHKYTFNISAMIEDLSRAIELRPDYPLYRKFLEV
jgi:hypothetical protein